MRGNSTIIPGKSGAERGLEKVRRLLRNKVVILRSGLRSCINSTVKAEKKGGVNLVNQEKDREKVICPKCSSDEVAHILYGYPTPEARKEAKSGKYHLGGCELGSFFGHCRKCKHEW